MSETRMLQILLGDGNVEHCTFKMLGVPPSAIVFMGSSLGELKFDGGDAFECLRLLRLYLENLGAQVLCMGARIDVFPSGFSRQQGHGEWAYITKWHTKMTKADRVNIFDYAPSQLVGRVEEQERFHKSWFESALSEEA